MCAIALCNSSTLVRLLFHPGSLLHTFFPDDVDELRSLASRPRALTLVALHTIERMLRLPLTSEVDYLRLVFSARPMNLKWVPGFLVNCGVDNVLRKLDDDVKEGLGFSVRLNTEDALTAAIFRALYGRTELPKSRPGLFSVDPSQDRW